MAVDPANGFGSAGAIADDSTSTLRTTVSDITHLRFRWRWIVKQTPDYLAFFVDGIEKARISGEVDWKLEAFKMSPGDHSVEWRYVKDSAKSVGADSGWVDQV
jgi:hypothetical protein